MTRIDRILDANANRAREALRVMEEAGRFVLDDAGIAGALKALRHDLAAALRGFGGVELHRDTPGDVGTALSTRAERRRDSVAEVVIAAGKRLGEALRCLEEFGKLRDAEGAAAMKQIRYRAYEIERRLHEQLGGAGARQWAVCVIVSESLCAGRGWLDVAKAALDGGAECIQLREKQLEAGELLDRAGRLVDLARSDGGGGAGRGKAKGAAVIVNDRPDVALAAGADGVHLGQGDLPVEAARRLAGRRLVIGCSTHNLAEARRAVAAGADYCGVGAIFATATKARRPSGVEYVRRFVTRYPGVPHVAIGGITPGNVAEVVDAGARGVAVSSVVCGAKDPAKIVRQLRRALGGS